MTPHVALSSAAEHDLAEHAAFLGQHNPEVGERFLVAATETFNHLLAAPTTGEVFKSKKQTLSGLRVWRIHGFLNHVCVYRRTTDGIVVVRVFHAAQDWQRLLESCSL